MSPDHNEPFRMLDEFVCDAILATGVIPPETPMGVPVDEGIRVLNEVVVDLSAFPIPPGELKSLLGALTEPQQTALRVLVESGSLAEIARALGLTPPQARDVLLATVDSIRTRLAG